MLRVAFDTFAVWLPSGWGDITDSVEAADPPYTVAARDGFGTLQFSVALYRSGPVPHPTPAVLLEMVEEFGRGRGLGEPSVVVTEPGPPTLAAGSFAWGEEFVRVWQVSDGHNFAFVTYTYSADDAGPEVATCEQILRSIEFLTG